MKYVKYARIGKESYLKGLITFQTRNDWVNIGKYRIFYVVFLDICMSSPTMNVAEL